MSGEYRREAGKRIKSWDMEGDMRLHIEGTGEYPIMYRGLGTKPQTEHPYNVYGDIQSQPSALAETFDLNREKDPALARKLVQRLALMFDRREHRRHLINFTTKTDEGTFDHRSIDSPDRPRFQHLTIGVTTIGAHTELYARPIFFV